MAKTTIESDRLRLESLNVEDHLHGFHKLMTDPVAMKWSSRGPSQSLEDSKTRILDRIDKTWSEHYAIILRPDTLIGRIGTPRISDDGERLELGYGLHSDYWGRGYASEALDLFKKAYWDESNKAAKNVLEAATEADNLASERVLIKAGFKRIEEPTSMPKTLVKVKDEVSGEKEEVKLNFWSLERPSSV